MKESTCGASSENTPKTSSSWSENNRPGWSRLKDWRPSARSWKDYLLLSTIWPVILAAAFAILTKCHALSPFTAGNSRSLLPINFTKNDWAIGSAPAAGKYTRAKMTIGPPARWQRPLIAAGVDAAKQPFNI